MSRFFYTGWRWAKRGGAGATWRYRPLKTKTAPEGAAEFAMWSPLRASAPAAIHPKADKSRAKQCQRSRLRDCRGSADHEAIATGDRAWVPCIHRLLATLRIGNGYTCVEAGWRRSNGARKRIEDEA